MNREKWLLLFIGCSALVLLLTAANFEDAYIKPEHCYSLLAPISYNSNMPSEIIEIACFETFAQAMYEATNKQIDLDPSSGLDDITDEMINSLEYTDLPDAQVVIGIDWDYTNYGGNSNIWVTPDIGCSPSLQYQVPSMPVGWNDRVSSSKAYSNCSFYHYRDTNYGGSYVICDPNCSTMGSLDNATSSEKWLYSP
jgi:hypothetical protein